MSEKRDLAKEIRLLQAEIQNLEIKRSRSQSSLIEALISHTEPDQTDVDYFRAYTAQIDVKRERLKAVTKSLENLI